MIDLQTVLTYLTLISVPVGVFYHIMTLRNTQKTRELSLKAQEQALETRQAQLLMDLYEAYRNPTFKKQFDHVLFRMDFEDWEDFNRKLDPLESPDERVIWFSVISFLTG